MKPPLQFEWDEEKAADAEARRAEGHVPFEFGAEAFFEPDVVYLQDPRDYGDEERWWAFARPQGVPVRVTFTVRGEFTRIISAHVASKRERRQLWPS